MAPNVVDGAAGAVGGEHRVRMPAVIPHGGGGAAAAGKTAAAATPAEKGLNRFVRFVVLMERVGNALGTLAFTWATVVLLGGYASDLGKDDPKDDGSHFDFWYATAIVFLEATRMFTRNNRLDYQLFFNTRGAFRPVGWNALIAILCFFDVFVILLKRDYMSNVGLLLMAIILAIGRFLSGLKLHICNPLRRATSLWSPLVAILLMAPPLPDSVSQYIYDDPYDHPVDTSTRWIVFTTLLVPVLLVTISRLRFARIIKLVDSTLGNKKVFWRRVIVNLCMIVALGMQVFMLRLDMDLSVIMIVQACALAVVSFGNFQIPAAVVRIVLSLLRLGPIGDNTKYDHNLVASLKIFYGMVLGQGMLYVLACALEFFSFIPRRYLVRCGGFRGQQGVESVNLYYAYAFEKCMQEGVLAPKKISFSTFAMDSVNSDSSKNQFYGIWMMHGFLQSEPTKTWLLSELTSSSKTMTRIIRMLDWKSQKDTTIRLYAAKVTTELAKDLCVATFPGTVQHVSAVFDVDSRRKRGNPLLDADDEQEEKQDHFLSTEDSQEEEHDELRDVAHDQEQIRDQHQGTDNQKGTQAISTQPVVINEENSCMLRCWRRISDFWSIPKEQPLTDHDFLPALAMSIIGNLAGCGQDNCVEIVKAADLIPKIIGFTSYKSDTTSDVVRQKVLLKSSLKVLQRLTRIDGEIGITLRYEISKHRFLLRNLTEILQDSMNSQEFRKLVAGIIRNIAVDGSIRQEIGRTQLTINMLMQAFLNTEGTKSTDADHLLEKVAGQALAMLTTESVQNCLVMLKEPEFIKKLKIMIHDDKLIYVAATLLCNLCQHARTELTESDLKELPHALRKVLERIKDIEGAELEILIGLSSQICKIIPEDFTRELHDIQIKRRFVNRLVDALNANTKTRAQPHCPGIRRVILEQVINMVECNYCYAAYADCFNEFKLAETLSTVEQTLSEAENYRFFLGDTGLMEYSTPISALVARAKELTAHD